MKKTIYLVLAGLSLAGAGVAMLTSEKIGISTAKILVPLLFILSGALSIMFGNANSSEKRSVQYHMFQGILMIVFGLIFGFATKDLGSFLKYATYFILIIGLYDLIYGFMLLNSDFKWTFKHLIFKFSAAFLGLIGGVAILATSVTDQLSGLTITGIVTIIIGIAMILFANRIKGTPAE